MAELLVSSVVLASLRVLSAVAFDNEPSLDAGEIDYIGRNRVLPSKAPSVLTAAQPLPEELLDFGHVTTQFARPPDQERPTSHFGLLAIRGLLFHCPRPRPNPPPQAGEGKGEGSGD